MEPADRAGWAGLGLAWVGCLGCVVAGWAGPAANLREMLFGTKGFLGPKWAHGAGRRRTPKISKASRTGS